jgi:hypothetical protein
VRRFAGTEGAQGREERQPRSQSTGAFGGCRGEEVVTHLLPNEETFLDRIAVGRRLGVPFLKIRDGKS